jgi:DNA polymerase-3 subunit gamma/tau
VRDLKEKIVLAPAESRYKVYIIDEVHMLSTSAFNALLKTLEEPPAHAVFVLVTTEPHRIPATVLSRCQRFDFRRVSFTEITGRLRTIAQEDGIAIDDAALAQITRSADGSVRDAESILDQLSAYADGTIDRDLVTSVLGLIDDETAVAFAEAAIRHDVAGTLRLAQDTADAGKDIRQVLRSLLEHFRDLLLVKTCGPQAAEILDASQERFRQLAAQAEGPSIGDLLRAVRVLNDAVSDARWNTQPRLALEVALIRIARPEMDPTLEGVLARIDRLEAGGSSTPVARGGPGGPVPATEHRPTERPVIERPAVPSRPGAPRRPHERTESADAPHEATVTEKVGAGDSAQAIVRLAATAEPAATADVAAKAETAPPLITIEDVRRQWARVLEDIKRTKMLCHALLIDGTPLEVTGDVLIVGLRSVYTFHMENLNRTENRDIVEASLAKVLARPLRFRCRLFEEPAAHGGDGSPATVSAPAQAAAAAEDSPLLRADGARSSLVDRARELFGAEIVEERPAG